MPEHHELIFQEFAQVENPLQHKAKGTGLGLPLSKRLAELLGGTVAVRERAGNWLVIHSYDPLCLSTYDCSRLFSGRPNRSKLAGCQWFCSRTIQPIWPPYKPC